MGRRRLPDGGFDSRYDAGRRSLDPTTGAELTFGEFALNLTAAGILAGGRPCVNFSTGDPISRTRQQHDATLEDIVDDRRRSSSPTAAASPFTKSPSRLHQRRDKSFTTVRLNSTGATSSPRTVTRSLTPDGAGEPPVTHHDMLISPDYVVTETDCRTGWTSIDGSGLDRSTRASVTSHLYSKTRPFESYRRPGVMPSARQRRPAMSSPTSARAPTNGDAFVTSPCSRPRP